MKLDNHDLYSLFRDRNIGYLYHANTMVTSLTFLKQNGLMSRGCVEDKDLDQTPQSSDRIDRDYGIWYDIFLDFYDLHSGGFGYYKRQNVYGPILFKINIDFIKQQNFNVWITKDNPTNWRTLEENQRYFSSVEELNANWDQNVRYHKMITLRDVNRPVLFDYLEKIIIDRPTRLNDLLNDEFLEKIIEKFTFNIEYRERCNNCYCSTNYNQMTSNEIKRLFSTKL